MAGKPSGPATKRRYDSGTQTEHEYANDLERREKPWTMEEYEKVRMAARAVVRGYKLVPCQGIERATVSGSLMWELMGALDRARPNYD